MKGRDDSGVVLVEPGTHSRHGTYPPCVGGRNWPDERRHPVNSRPRAYKAQSAHVNGPGRPQQSPPVRLFGEQCAGVPAGLSGLSGAG